MSNGVGYSKATAVYCPTPASFTKRLGRVSDENGTRWMAPGFYDTADGMLQSDNRMHGEICAPMVMRDVPEHTTDWTSLITSRSQLREHMKRTDTVPFEKDGMKGRPITGILNEKTAAASGLPYSPEHNEHMSAATSAAWKNAGLNSDGSGAPIDINIKL